jgi:regulator of replication initiation timing
MSDLIATHWDTISDLRKEIKRLQAELERLSTDNVQHMVNIKRLTAENERLEEELSKWKYITADYEISAAQQEHEKRIELLEAENNRLAEIVCEAFESDDPGSFKEWCDMNGYRLDKGK